MENKLAAAAKASPKCGLSCRPLSAPLKGTDASLAGQVKIFFANLFDTSDWPARWHCGTWSNFHGWLYIISDLSIWAAYFLIPILLFRIIKKKKDIPFPRILWLFIAFILLCGTTHLLDALMFWWPAYRLSGLIRLLTGIISLFTVYALYNMLPMIFNLRTLQELETEISERKKAEEEVRNHQVLQKAAEELMAKKDEFMTIASHELKTPVTSVKASLQMLKKMVGQNETLSNVAPFVQIASRQVNKLTGLINELLDVTRIQAGKLELNKTEFNVMKMVTECVEHCTSADGNHRVIIKGDKDLTLIADFNKTDQVLCNLLTNAFKYSPDSLEVEIYFNSTANNKVKFQVLDRGIGIPGDKIDHIFDRFFRVENTSQNYPGIGLGLYISSQIVKEHGGEIGVTSEVGHGTRFWFEI